MFNKQHNHGCLERICFWLKTLCQRRWIVFLGAVVLVCLVVLKIRSSQFPVGSPDSALWYDAEHLEKFFCGDGEALRGLYVLTQVSFDSVLPLAYGMLLGMLIVKFYPFAQASRWIVFPCSTVVCDFLENALLVSLAITWECEANPLPVLASVVPYVSCAKWLLISISITVAVAGWIHPRGEQDQSSG